MKTTAWPCLGPEFLCHSYQPLKKYKLTDDLQQFMKPLKLILSLWFPLSIHLLNDPCPWMSKTGEWEYLSTAHLIVILSSGSGEGEGWLGSNHGLIIMFSVNPINLVNVYCCTHSNGPTICMIIIKIKKRWIWASSAYKLKHNTVIYG